MNQSREWDRSDDEVTMGAKKCRPYRPEMVEGRFTQAFSLGCNLAGLHP
jgi:hypothetical protein